jgi:hypothetical protein
MALAESLKENNTLIELSVIGQSQAFGEAALQKMTEMFDYNIILQKINWRLHSRQSFALNKLISRNVDINRRIAAGQKLEDYINTVPGPRKHVFGLPSDYIWVEGGPAPPVGGRPASHVTDEKKHVTDEKKHVTDEKKHMTDEKEPVTDKKEHVEPEYSPQEEKKEVEAEIITSPLPPPEEKVPQTVSEENDVLENDVLENDN